MNCPGCGNEVLMYVEESGGCMGGHGDDSRCYCDVADTSFKFRCKTKSCKFGKRNFIISDLSDKYSIERFVIDNYKPNENTLYV